MEGLQVCGNNGLSDEQVGSCEGVNTADTGEKELQEESSREIFTELCVDWPLASRLGYYVV